MAIPDPLRTTPFINLRTFKRSGEAVATPVWAAELEGALYVFSQTDTGKVKRIRNSSQVQVAECTAGGKIKGAWHDATACLVTDPAREQAAYSALRNKYGWKMKILDLGARISGKARTRTVIRVDF